MAELSLIVEGMTCPHCQKAVEMALQTLDGVSSASVDLKAKKVDINFDPQKTNEQKLKDAITNAGYQVRG